MKVRTRNTQHATRNTHETTAYDVGGKDVNLWDEPAEGNIVRDAKTGAIRAGTLNQLVANLASQQRMGTERM